MKRHRRKRNDTCRIVEPLEARQLLSVTLVSAASAAQPAAGNQISGEDTTAGLIPASVSANGQYIAFISDATNLVSGVSDNNKGADVFVRNSATAKTTLVSADIAGNATGNQPSGISPASIGAGGGTESIGPVISPDGKYVAFVSSAGNLISGENNPTNSPQIYPRNLQTNTTALITENLQNKGVSIGKTVGDPVFSADDQYIAFVSDAKDLTTGLALATGTNIFIRNLSAGTTELVSAAKAGAPANGAAIDPSISADGKTVAFVSTASNLVPGVIGAIQNVYIRNVTTGTTILASPNVIPATSTSVAVSTGGNAESDSPILSPNGAVVAFSSTATNLVTGFLGTVDPDLLTPNVQVFAYNVAAAKTTLVSGAAKSLAGNISAAATTSLTQAGNGNAGDPSISADGRYIVYADDAQTLVGGFTSAGLENDIYRYDTTAGTNQLVTLDYAGTAPANAASDVP